MSVREATPDLTGACGEGPQISRQKGWVPHPREGQPRQPAQAPGTPGGIGPPLRAPSG